jgi:hypothetical protein
VLDFDPRGIGENFDDVFAGRRGSEDPRDRGLRNGIAPPPEVRESLDEAHGAG